MYRTAMSIPPTSDAVFEKALRHTLSKTAIRSFPKTEGKVRDIYDLGGRLLLVTTDRLSAFDRRLTTIPFKGQVLNQISAFWFDQTKDIVPNHMISTPYANAMLVKKLKIFPIEFVVRGYITGTTNTALWTLYQSGLRTVSGVTLPDNLIKHQALPSPILTPTTKALVGDRPIEKEDIIKEGLMSESDWENAADIAMKLYQRGRQLAAEHDLILVDTKFEMGKDPQGNIVLVDEAMTPDSSRYWRLSNYDTHMSRGEDPDNFDKEKMRLWYKAHCNPYKDKALPNAPDDIRIEVAKIYISLYEQMTGQAFHFNEKRIESETTTITDVLTT